MKVTEPLSLFVSELQRMDQQLEWRERAIAAGADPRLLERIVIERRKRELKKLPQASLIQKGIVDSDF